MTTQKIRIIECTRCGYKWTCRRKELPKTCTRCSSRYWNKQRIQPTKGHPPTKKWDEITLEVKTKDGR